MSGCSNRKPILVVGCGPQLKTTVEQLAKLGHKTKTVSAHKVTEENIEDFDVVINATEPMKIKNYNKHISTGIHPLKYYGNSGSKYHK